MRVSTAQTVLARRQLVLVHRTVGGHVAVHRRSHRLQRRHPCRQPTRHRHIHLERHRLPADVRAVHLRRRLQQFRRRRLQSARLAAVDHRDRARRPTLATAVCVASSARSNSHELSCPHSSCACRALAQVRAGRTQRTNLATYGVPSTAPGRLIGSQTEPQQVPCGSISRPYCLDRHRSAGDPSTGHIGGRARGPCPRQLWRIEARRARGCWST